MSSVLSTTLENNTAFAMADQSGNFLGEVELLGNSIRIKKLYVPLSIKYVYGQPHREETWQEAWEEAGGDIESIIFDQDELSRSQMVFSMLPPRTPHAV